jgi:hypothetical protein
MGVKIWLVAAPALAALAGGLVYGRKLVRCQQSCSIATAADESSYWGSSSTDECCAPVEMFAVQSRAPELPMNSDEQIVFKLEGLGCPAVSGIGCGHMLHPLLASLDKIDGVQASFANFTGSMIRVSVNRADDRERVAELARRAVAANDPVALSGEELDLALTNQQWRESSQVGELSAIEFRTIVFARIKAFAQTENLDKQTTDKLTELAKAQWQRIEQGAKKDKATLPEDWLNRVKKSIPDFLSRVKDVLSDAQFERFKQALLTTEPDEVRPAAQAAPGD